MKTSILSISLLIMISGCTANKFNTETINYHQGIEDNYLRKYYLKDSLSLVSPSIELYYKSEENSYTIKKDEDFIRTSVVEILKSELDKEELYRLDLMTESHRTINRFTEKVLYDKFQHPDWIMKAPEPLLIDKQKYSLLITLTARYGKVENGIIYFAVINNVKKNIELSIREHINYKVLDTSKLRNTISKGLFKITNQQ